MLLFNSAETKLNKLKKDAKPQVYAILSIGLSKVLDTL